MSYAKDDWSSLFKYVKPKIYDLLKKPLPEDVCINDESLSFFMEIKNCLDVYTLAYYDKQLCEKVIKRIDVYIKLVKKLKSDANSKDIKYYKSNFFISRICFGKPSCLEQFKLFKKELAQVKKAHDSVSNYCNIL
ncbi:MAG: hypothetical protein PVG30_04200 [Gammaproteobacteria bacterium]|jgi:hypothetical protein